MPSISKMSEKITENFARKSVFSFFVSFFKNTAAVVAALTVATMAITLICAYVLSLRAPRPRIIVQLFEESLETGKKCGLTGKNVEDIFVDRLNELTSEAASFHGGMYSTRNALSRLPEQPKIPVETTYGITVHGISLDDVVKLYNRVRYEEWNVSGDVFTEGDICHLRVRLEKDKGTSSWEIAAIKGYSLSDSTRNAALKLISEAHPELAGRALLQEIVQLQNSGVHPDSVFIDAKDAFGRWITANPEDKRAYFYLITTLVYEGRYREAGLVANWLFDWPILRKRVDSTEAARLGTSARPRQPDARPGSEESESIEDKIESAFAAAKLSQAATEAGVDTTSSEEESAIEGLKRLDNSLKRLAHIHPSDPKYLSNSAVASDLIAVNLRKAEIRDPENDQLKRAIRSQYEGAVQLLERAVDLDPFNAGTHLNLGAELDMLNRYSEGNSQDAIDEMRYSLHLRPGFRIAFEKLEGVLIKSKRFGEAQELCDVVPLLLPTIQGKLVYRCELAGFPISTVADSKLHSASSIASTTKSTKP